MTFLASESVVPPQQKDGITSQTQRFCDPALSLVPAPEQASAIAKLIKFGISKILDGINALRALSPFTHDHLLALFSLRYSPDDDVKAWLVFGRGRASEIIAPFSVTTEIAKSLRSRHMLVTPPGALINPVPPLSRLRRVKSLSTLAILHPRPFLRFPLQNQ